MTTEIKTRTDVSHWVEWKFGASVNSILCRDENQARFHRDEFCTNGTVIRKTIVTTVIAEVLS